MVTMAPGPTFSARDFPTPHHLLSQATTHGHAALRGAVLANYAFDKYFSDPKKAPHIVPKLAVLGDGGHAIDTDNTESVKVGGACRQRRVDGTHTPRATLQTLADATVLARDLTNERADVATPQFLEDVARNVAASHGMEVRRFQSVKPLQLQFCLTCLCSNPGDIRGGN